MKAYTKDGLVWIDANGGWSVQIPDPDAMPVLGVPLGSTVEADAFVLGTARVVALQGIEGGKCAIAGGHWMYATDVGRVFGCEIPVGEFRQFAIVPLAEPQSEGETVQSIESPVPLIAESPECGTEKVWLCCERSNRFHLASGKKPEMQRGLWDREDWDWDDTELKASTARLIHPSHNLHPGECCEVPAREEHWMELEDLKAFRNAMELGRHIEVSPGGCELTFWLGGVDGEQCQVGRKVIDLLLGDSNRPTETVRYRLIPERYIPLTAEEADAACDDAPAISISPERIAEIVESVTGKPTSAPPVAESEGPRWEYTPATWETFVTRHELNDMYFGTNGMNRYTLRVYRYRDGTIRSSPPRHIEADLSILDEQFVAAHLAARERARELGLIEAGPPKFPENEIPCGFTIGPFIGEFGAPRRNYYVAKNSDGRDIIIRRGDGGWMGLVSTDGDRTARDWVESSPGDSDAQAFRQAYDRALSAGQLPPHPRWAKPEGAEVFLGWYGEASQFDAWWHGDGSITMPWVNNLEEIDSETRPTERMRLDSVGPYVAALARARELKLPERSQLKAKRAELEALQAVVAGLEREVGT